MDAFDVTKSGRPALVEKEGDRVTIDSVFLHSRGCRQTKVFLFSKELFYRKNSPKVSSLYWIKIVRILIPEINLTAYGGVSFAIAFVISSLIAMMPVTSTTLAKNWQAYTHLRTFMLTLGLSLTVIYAVVAFSPLYYVATEKLIGAPAEIIEPGRMGLMLLMPFP